MPEKDAEKLREELAFLKSQYGYQERALRVSKTSKDALMRQEVMAELSKKIEAIRRKLRC